MVWSSSPNELNTSLIISLKYLGYKWYSSKDTNDKIVLYYFPNNYNSSDGYCQISKTIVYRNEGTNHSNAYIEVHKTDILDGFNESSVVKSVTGKFVIDTMILDFGIQPSSGPVYGLKCKYKKM